MNMLEMHATQNATALLRADRVSRMGNKYLGRLKLDQPTFEQISSTQIGLFAEGFLSLDMMLGRVLPLADRSREIRTIVVYACKEDGKSAYDWLVAAGRCALCSRNPEQWQLGNLAFTSVEGLSRHECEYKRIDCVILLDPTCMVHRARTLTLGNGTTHDRPQIIASFLAERYNGGIPPILMLMTMKRAAAVASEAIARAYCLETFWFLDGTTLRC